MNPLILILGLGLTAFGYVILQKNRRLAKVGVKTMAKVVDISKQHETDSEGYSTTSYYPVLEFQDDKQQAQRFQGNVGGGKRKYQIGQELEILYDPADSAKAQMKSVSSQWIMPVVVMLIGILMIVGGLTNGL